MDVTLDVHLQPAHPTRAAAAARPRRAGGRPLAALPGRLRREHIITMPVPRIDCHLHIWSGDHDKFPFNRERGGSPAFNIPPDAGGLCGTAEQLLAAQADVNVAGAMIVQPVHHGFDHSYITDAMRRYPGKFKASLVIDPHLAPRAAAAEVQRLHGEGWGGVRFKPGLWPEGVTPLGDDTGRAVVAKCGELAMPVGLLCSVGKLSRSHP